jgi:peptide deformylase
VIRSVVTLPDPGLTQRASPVGEIDDVARSVARDLLDTMRASTHSVGIAAPQIGVAMRVFALDVTGHRKARSCHGEVVVFDPVVVDLEGRDLGREGCMSVPDLTGDVARATRVLVRGMGLDGKVCELACDAFEARAVQHEIDHLDGRLFLDRVVAADRVFRRRVYR